MSVRINVILAEETVRVLDRAAPRGHRSRLISEAVMHYVSSRGGTHLAAQLKAGALANAKHVSVGCLCQAAAVSYIFLAH